MVSKYEIFLRRIFTKVYDKSIIYINPVYTIVLHKIEKLAVVQITCQCFKHRRRLRCRCRIGQLSKTRVLGESAAGRSRNANG